MSLSPTSSSTGTPSGPRASVWRLAIRQLLRDFRAGELRLLMLALLLAVGSLTAVGFFADRLGRGLTRDARQLLGGDAMVVSDQPTPPSWAAQAASDGLAVTSSAVFPSMGRAPDEKGGASRLVTVKSVGTAYPLRGHMLIGDTPDSHGRSVHGGPQPGTVWTDASLLEALQLKLGDSLLLGDATLRIAAVIIQEPDRGSGFLSFSPRVMLSERDLAATRLIQPASRVTYRFGVAASSERDETRVARFVAWAEAQIEARKLRGIRVETLESGRPELQQTLERAGKFLSLVALLSALLAAVAVGIAARDFAARRLDACAMLRVLGQSQRAIAGQYLIEFAVVGVLASIGGVLLGWLAHQVFIWLLAGLVSASLPMPSAWPVLLGGGVGMSLLFGFGVPPVLQLAQVPPLRVMRRELGALQPRSALALVAGGLGFAAILLAASSDLSLGLIAVGGFAAAAALFAVVAWAAVTALRHAVPEAGAPRWLVLATRQLASRPAFAVLQVSALAVGLLALCLLVLLRTDLVSSWRQATPADAPNRFVINIQPDQGDAFRQLLEQRGVTHFDWYPMFRGRLEAINGQAIQPEALASDRARRLVDREFNLSHAAELPAHNELSAGRWVAEEEGALSVEQGLADTLGLKLGDRLRFDMAGQPIEGRVTSLRELDWGSMHANFFVMFPRARMDEVSSTYMAAFLAPGTAGFDNALSREFPNVTVVDVSASIAQIQRVLEQVVRAVELLFGFTLAAGLVVLFTTLSASRESRARELAVMRALGAGDRLLGQVQRAELLGVGALAGLLAASAAMAVGWALAERVFNFSWTASPWTPLWGATAGAVLAWAAGWWALREVARRPVMEVLRRAAE